jgi:uncharacterized phage protein (TIGR01671 family)
MIPKFRCFDKDTKTMHEVVAIDFKDWRVYYEAYGLRSYWNKNVALMQSTGLHDKHGVEIFQGDVVKIVYDGEPFTGVVVYDLGEADFKATNNHEDYGNNFQYLTVGESIEVIGDIHKNPELLEGVIK